MSVISKMTFDNGSTKNLISSTFYGKCVTAAATAAKTVTIGGWDESVKDNVSGATVHIYFENGNSASNPTLNIDSQGAHKIITSLDTSIGSFSAGVYSFTLVPSNVPSDNTYRWLMQANIDWSNVSNKPSLNFIPLSQKGANSGVAELDANGKVPSSQLPSYVDDVINGYYNPADELFYKERTFVNKITGESDKIYIDLDSNKTYRWSGLTTFIEISASLALGETSSTAYRGDRGATAYTHATDSGRLTTAASSGLYKISVTGEGHVGSATAVTKSDITALGIPGEIPDKPTNNGTYSLNVSSGTASWTAVAPSGLQPPSSNGHYMLGVSGSSVSWESSPDLYAIEQLSGTSGLLKKTAENTWTLDTTSYAPTVHSHGNIDRYGRIETTATIGANDKLAIIDYNDENAVKASSISFSSSGTGFLKEDGTWGTPNAGVTSITIKGTSPISVDSTAAITTTGTRTISLANSYGDTKNPYAAKVANTVLAGPASGNDAAPTFRQLVAADIPLLTKSKISDFPTSMPASDVSDWAKAATKPSYSLSEISGTDDLQEIESLTGTTGLLKKTAANTWTLDTTTYLASSAISDWAKASTKPSYSLSEIDGTQDLRKIEALADSSTGFLKKTAANTWALDSTTYATSSDISSAINALDGSVTGTAAASKTLTAFSQTNGKVTATFSDISITKSQVSDFPTSMPASDVSDWAKASTKPSYALSELTGASDVQAIEALTGTSGLLKKTAANTWSLDTTSYLPTTGGNVTGDIVLLKQVSSGAPGDSYSIIFQRGVLTDNYNDWKITDSGGYLHFYERGSGSSSWNDRVVFNTTGNVSAASFSGSGASLTSLNASNLSSGTVPIARLPDLSSTYIPTSEKGAASGVAELDTNSKVPVVQSNYLYGKCTTAGGTAAKTVTIAGYDESTIANMEGVTVFVAFKNVSTASNPTLNVSGAGAHAIVTGTYDDPVAIGKFTNGLHAFTLVKALDNNYYWWINEGRDTVPEAPTTTGTYLLTINSSGNVSWSSYTPPVAATTGTVALSASGWSGNGPYSHSVTISGTTANSKIDLQPDSTVLAQMTTDGTTALYIENNNGTLTAWAMGAAPTATLTIQYTKTEVA